MHTEEFMNNVIKILVMVLGITGIVGCSQEKQTESTIIEEKETSNEEVVNALIGTWANDRGAFTIDKDSNKLIMHMNQLDSNIVTNFNLQFELRDVDENKISTLFVKKYGEQIDTENEDTFTFKDKQKLIMETSLDNLEYTKMSKVNDPDYKDITSMLVGNWANEDAYIRISKRNNNIVTELRDEQEDINWENTTEVKGNAGNTIVGVNVDTTGEAEDLGMLVFLTLKDNGGLSLGSSSSRDTLELNRTGIEREKWEVEKKER